MGKNWYDKIVPCRPAQQDDPASTLIFCSLWNLVLLDIMPDKCSELPRSISRKINMRLGVPSPEPTEFPFRIGRRPRVIAPIHNDEAYVVTFCKRNNSLERGCIIMFRLIMTLSCPTILAGLTAVKRCSMHYHQSRIRLLRLRRFPSVYIVEVVASFIDR